MKTLQQSIILVTLLLVTALFAQQRTEIPEKRTANSKTFQKTDGTYQLEISLGRQHYKDNAGEYQEINTRLEADSDRRFKVSQGRYKAFFKSASKENRTVRFQTSQDIGLDFEIVSIGYYDRSVNTYQIIENTKNVQAIVKDNTILYKNIFNGVDCKYTYQASRLKEDIYLSQRTRNNLPNPENYGFNPQTTYLMVQMIMYQDSNLYRIHDNIDITESDYETEGYIAFYDATGKELFGMANDLAHLELNEKSMHFEEATEYEAVLKRFYRENDTQYLLAGVPVNWIKRMPEGAIIIDPTITLDDSDSEDAFVFHCTKTGDEAKQTTNYGSATVLYVIKWTHSPGYKTYRTYIKFDLSSLPAEAKIVNAELTLKNSAPHGGGIEDRYDDADTYIRRVTGSWAENTITYVNQPATIEDNKVYVSPPANDSQEMTADVTQLVKDILNNTNYGFQIKLVDETHYRGLYYASKEHATSGLHPKLVIDYVESDVVYYLKDHLGNIRVTVDESGDVVTADDYYPFGLQMSGRSYNVAFSGNQYKYNSKEWDDENKLNWYWYGPGRYLDPEIARWVVPDPLFEKYPSHTPYNYVLNRPTVAIDPNGKDVEIIIGLPYKDKNGENHPYGHMAIRVVNENTDVVYDFGRYGKTWGIFDQYGDGILNIRKGSYYIASENTIRNSKGYYFDTSIKQDEAVMSFFKNLTKEDGAKLLYLIDQKTGQRYKLSEKRDYHWSDNNCVTISIEALKEVGIDIFDPDTYKPMNARDQLDEYEKDKEERDKKSIYNFRRSRYYTSDQDANLGY